MPSDFPEDHSCDPLAHLPGYALRRAASAMMAELSVRLAEVELRISDASVLLLIGQRTDMTSADIGKILDIKRANMVPLLHRLVAAGLVVRVPIDRKSQAIVVTVPGMEKVERLHTITNAFETDLYARIPVEHREHLLPALHALWK